MREIREILDLPFGQLSTEEAERLHDWLAQPGVEQTPEWKEMLEKKK